MSKNSSDPTEKRLARALDDFKELLVAKGYQVPEKDMSKVEELMRFQLALAAKDRGELGKATLLLNQAMTIRQKLGDDINAAPEYHQLAILARLANRFDEAAVAFGNALKEYESLGDSTNVSRVRRPLGDLAINKGASSAGEDLGQSLVRSPWADEAQSSMTVPVGRAGLVGVGHERIIQETFRFDKRIKFAAMLDHSGRQIAGGMRKGIPSLEPVSEDLKLIANITIQLSTDKTWDQYFGKTQFTFIKREKVNILTLHLGDKLIMVSTEPDFTLQQALDLRNQIVTNHLAEFT